jgi:hypothetical protein
MTRRPRRPNDKLFGAFWMALLGRLPSCVSLATGRHKERSASRASLWLPDLMQCVDVGRKMICGIDGHAKTVATASDSQ